MRNMGKQNKNDKRNYNNQSRNPVFRLMAGQWHLYLAGFVTMIISIFLDMQAPRITQKIIDDVIVEGRTELLMQLILALLGIGVGRCIFQYIKEFCLDKAGVMVGRELRVTLFRHIQTLSISFFDRNNTGELMARIKDDVDKIWSITGFVGMFAVECIIHTFSVLYCMFLISPVLTLIPFIIMPIVGFLAVRMEGKLGEVYGEISEQNAELTTVAQENLAGVRTVRAFAREEHEIKKFKMKNQGYYNLNIKQAKTIAKYNPNISFCTKLILIAVIMVGGIMVMGGTITLGALGAFAEYANNIIWPMECIGWISNEFASAVASYKKIDKILEQEAEIISRKSLAETENLRGEIEFSHVDFSMQGRKILSDINFHIKPGKTLGIMGVTGSGKTSAVNLMQRFYEVTDGEIRMDGKNIKELDLEVLRRSMAVVMQDVFLFSDTIQENIIIGKRKELDLATVSEAAKTAGAENFIEKLSNRYETVVGERGVGLSGGQKQRISIARALAKKTPILILDDSTSALDMETESRIQKELDMLNGMTKIIIAHRISSVRHADEIIVLDSGRIIERGTHDVLMEKKGQYYRTYCTQYDLAEHMEGGQNVG